MEIVERVELVVEVGLVVVGIEGSAVVEEAKQEGMELRDAGRHVAYRCLLKLLIYVVSVCFLLFCLVLDQLFIFLNLIELLRLQVLQLLRFFVEEVFMHLVDDAPVLREFEYVGDGYEFLFFDELITEGEYKGRSVADQEQVLL